MSSPADELRQAASALRPTPGDKSQLVAIRIPAGVDAGVPLGAALADWLDATATSLEASTHPGWQECVASDALAVARAINGGQP